MSGEHALRGRTLLVLAASVQQVPLIRRCLSMGARIVTLDNRPENPGHALAHRSVNADVRDIAAVIAAIRTEAAEAVVAAASDVALETAAEVTARLGLVGPPLAVRDALLSKIGFRGLQDALGLPAPAWARAGESLPGDGAWIVKPSRGSGSRGIRVVGVSADLPSALHAAAVESRDGEAMFETWLPGSQHTAEGWMQEGQVAAMMLTERLTARWPHVATLGHRAPAGISPAAHAAIKAQIETVFRHLGYMDGPFDADVVLSATGPVLVEISPRAGGNGLMHMVGAATDFDHMGMIALHALGLLPRIAPWQVAPVGVQILSDPEGGILRYDSAAVPSLRAEPWIVDLTLDLPTGARVPPFTDGRSRYGQVVFTADSGPGLEVRLHQVRSRLGLTVM